MQIYVFIFIKIGKIKIFTIKEIIAWVLVLCWVHQIHKGSITQNYKSIIYYQLVSVIMHVCFIYSNLKVNELSNYKKICKNNRISMHNNFITIEYILFTVGGLNQTFLAVSLIRIKKIV